MRLILLFSFLFLVWVQSPGKLFSQSLGLPVSYTGLGSLAYSHTSEDIFGMKENIAALGGLKQAGFGAYAERRFFLNPLRLFNGMLAWPSSLGAFAVSIDYFGYPEYHESEFGLGYAKELAAAVRLGVRFNYYSVNIPGYLSAGTLVAEAGVMFQLTERISAGLHVYNPFGGKLKRGPGEKLASLYRFGGGYDASGQFYIGFEVEKLENEPVFIHLNLHYQFTGSFFLAGGWEASRAIPWVAVGFTRGKLRLDLRVSHHPMLGFSNGLGLSSFWGKKPGSTNKADEKRG